MNSKTNFNEATIYNCSKNLNPKIQITIEQTSITDDIYWAKLMKDLEIKAKTGLIIGQSRVGKGYPAKLK